MKSFIFVGKIIEHDGGLAVIVPDEIVEQSGIQVGDELHMKFSKVKAKKKDSTKK